MSDTPRTDAESFVCEEGTVVSAYFAETLERELAQMTRERDQARLHADAEAVMCDLVAKERDALRAEVERLRGALLTLANAADTVGVMHFDSDSWPQEVDAMRDATIAARAALQEPTP